MASSMSDHELGYILQPLDRVAQHNDNDSIVSRDDFEDGPPSNSHGYEQHDKRYPTPGASNNEHLLGRSQYSGESNNYGDDPIHHALGNQSTMDQQQHLVHDASDLNYIPTLTQKYEPSHHIHNQNQRSKARGNTANSRPNSTSPWRRSGVMTAFLLSGASVALGHHFFYSALDGQPVVDAPVPPQLEQQHWRRCCLCF